MLPPPVIEQRDDLYIVRDDLLPGGTKRRALGVLLSVGDEFVYAGPACGYAQLALAHACRDYGKRATVFVAKRSKPTPQTLAASRAGAKVVQVPTGYLSNVRAKARAYCAASGAVLLPFGLDAPSFVSRLAEVAADLSLTPAEVWTVAGSGVLTRALQRTWPDAAFHAVRVGKAGDFGRAKVWDAPEKFEDAAREPPPFTSCENYDAKAWRFIRRHASPEALFWNVAA